MNFRPDTLLSKLILLYVFDKIEIDNDLKAVDTIIRKYYGLTTQEDKNHEET